MMSYDLLTRCVCVLFRCVLKLPQGRSTIFYETAVCVCVCVCARKVSQRVGNWAGEEASFCWHMERFGLETLETLQNQIEEPVL